MTGFVSTTESAVQVLRELCNTFRVEHAAFVTDMSVQFYHVRKCFFNLHISKVFFSEMSRETQPTVYALLSKGIYYGDQLRTLCRS